MLCGKLGTEKLKLAETHIVPEHTAKIRLSDYVRNIFETIPSRKGMKKAIDKGFVFVNNKPSGTGKFIGPGDKIELFLPEGFKKVYKYPVEVVYEDDTIAIVNKPAGMLSNGNAFKTLENVLPFNLKNSDSKEAMLYPQVMHRLDYPTSGIMLIAKTRTANVVFKKMFEERKIQKTYHALTIGNMNVKEGSIDKILENKNAVTAFKVVKSVPSNKYIFINLIELKPITGRRHQLRKHLAGIGHPILGDREYGSAKHWDMKKGLYLSATEIAFIHPITGEKMHFSIELPKKFQKLVGNVILPAQF